MLNIKALCESFAKKIIVAGIGAVALAAMAVAPTPAQADPPAQQYNSGNVNSKSWGGTDVQGGGGTSITGGGYAKQNINANHTQAGGSFAKITDGCGCNPGAQTGQWSTNNGNVQSESFVTGVPYGGQGSASGGYDTHGWNGNEANANLSFYVPVANNNGGGNGNGNNGGGNGNQNNGNGWNGNHNNHGNWGD